MLDVTQAASILRVDRRSCSAPGRTHQTETPGAHEDVNTGYQERTYPSQQSPSDEGVAGGEQRKSVKRASSVVLPAEWATMAFPLQHPAFNAGGGMMESPAEQSHLDLSDEESEHDDVPPAVPPKAPARKLVPFLHVSPLKPRPANGAPCNKALPQIETSNIPPLSSQAESKHVRECSGDSVMDRGRPMKRSRSQSRRGFMRAGQGSSVDLTNEVLPKGWSANSALANISREEMRKLEHQAKCQVGRFEVFNLKDVKALSQVPPTPRRPWSQALLT
jgi:hypothetical protein